MMRLINSIRSYILEDEFKITILDGKINIVNYSSIGSFDDSLVIVKYNSGDVVIRGEGLVVSRLMDDEILISGNIKTLEFR